MSIKKTATGDISDLFREMGKGLKENIRNKALQLGNRAVAAAVGRPLKQADIGKDKLAFLIREFESFSNGMTVQELREISESYIRPGEFIDVKGTYVKDLIDNFAVALAGALPLRPPYSPKSGNFTIRRGRVEFENDVNVDNSTRSYDLATITAALLASRNFQPVHEKTVEIHYPHFDKQGKIKATTLIVLQPEVAKKLEEAILKAQRITHLHQNIPAIARPVPAENKDGLLEQRIKVLSEMIKRAETRLQLYGVKQEPVEFGKEYVLSDLPDNIMVASMERLSKLNKTRKNSKLPELYFDCMPQASSLVRVAQEGNYPAHASDLMSSQTQIRNYGLLVVSTDRTARKENNKYDSTNVAFIFTHPRSAIKELQRLIDCLKRGENIPYPLHIVPTIDDFCDLVEREGMLGDK